MKKYEILEHKADLKIRAYGGNKEELFQNSLFGMVESMRAGIKKPEESAKREIKIKSSDLPCLLVDFLSEVLYLSQVNKEIYHEAKFKKFIEPLTGPGQAELQAELIGKKVTTFGQEIKAVTYHNLDIHQEENGNWQATVLFDI